MSKGLCPYVKMKTNEKRIALCYILYVFQFPSTKYLCIIYNVTKVKFPCCTMYYVDKIFLLFTVKYDKM